MSRKEYPGFEGHLKYFPLSFLEIAHISYIGSKQHHPDKQMHWDREKSRDHLDAAMRHLVDHARGNLRDTDGELHLAKAGWRVNAALELLLEKELENETP